MGVLCLSGRLPGREQGEALGWFRKAADGGDLSGEWRAESYLPGPADAWFFLVPALKYRKRLWHTVSQGTRGSCVEIM